MEASKSKNRSLAAFIGIPATLAIVFLGQKVLLIATLFLFIVCVYEFTGLLQKKEHSIVLVIIGIVYISFLLSINLIRRFESGTMLVLFVFLGTWAFDTSAYYVGTLWGEHKLVPKISPKKSLEGLLAGIAAVLIVSVFLTENITGYAILPFVKLLWAFSLSAAAFLGDLIESSFKRSVEVKDSSSILLGHGGFLDRFDSLMLTAPVSYIIFLWVLR